MKIRLMQTHTTLSMFSFSSLTDIVLLLLVFFLLTSSFIVSEGLNINLPEAENTSAAEQKQIRVSLLNDGSIFIDDQLTAPIEVKTAFELLIREPDKQVIVLSSDRDVPLNSAVFIMDEARAAGASRFFISTTPREEADDTIQQ